MMKQNYVTLNDGNKIPQFGLGVYMVRGDEPTREACLAALKMGYRHIDTAHAYQNERGVGKAVKESGIPREEIWITSKLWPSEYGEGKTMEGIDKMLSRLGTDDIDLLLLHWPFANYYAAWRTLEKLYADGKIQAIGVSNFEPNRLLDLSPTTRWSRRSARLRQIFTASAARSGAGWTKAGGPHGLRTPGAGLPERNVSGARRAGPSEKIRQDPGPGHAPLPDPERRRRHSQKHPAGAYPREF